jgi:hypothetical protein
MRDKLPLSAPVALASSCRVIFSSLRRLRMDKPSDMAFNFVNKT